MNFLVECLVFRSDTGLQNAALLSPAVECPVCSMQMKSHLINSHLDLCLNSSFLSSPDTTPPPSGERPGRVLQGFTYERKGTLRRLPKIVFSIMTDKQLRRKLKEYSLSPHGSRNDVIARLKEFTLQYRAQCDSLNPKSGGSM